MIGSAYIAASLMQPNCFNNDAADFCYRVSKKFGYHGFLYFTRKLLILLVWFKLLVIRNDFNSLVREKQTPVTIFYLSNNFDNAVKSD